MLKIALMGDKMNNEEMHLNEIQERLESEDWSRSIANRVSIRYEKKKQARNRILFSAVAIVILAIGIGVSFFFSIRFAKS